MSNISGMVKVEVSSINTTGMIEYISNVSKMYLSVDGIVKTKDLVAIKDVRKLWFGIKIPYTLGYKLPGGRVNGIFQLRWLSGNYRIVELFNPVSELIEVLSCTLSLIGEAGDSGHVYLSDHAVKYLNYWDKGDLWKDAVLAWEESK